MSALTRERPAILSGTAVSVNFRGLKALQQVDIRVPEGAITGLVGPNGAGKSTLLGVLSGDVVAQQGTVRLGGKDVSGLTPEARVRHGLARTFQLPQLFDELTVREHLTLPRRLAQAPSRAWSDPFTGRFLRPDALPTWKPFSETWKNCTVAGNCHRRLTVCGTCSANATLPDMAGCMR